MMMKIAILNLAYPVQIQRMLLIHFTEDTCFQKSIPFKLVEEKSRVVSFLASGGHDQKVVLWHFDTLKPYNVLEGHSLLVTDVCSVHSHHMLQLPLSTKL